MTHRLYNVLADRWNNPDRDPACPYVFPARTGDGHRGYSTKGIRAAMKKAGLNDDHKVKRYGKATFHSTRDTCATKIVRGGLSLADVQAQLGHATPAMSQKYAQASTSIASSRVAKLFNEIEHGRVIKKKAVA